MSQHIHDQGVWEKELSEIWYNHIRAGDLVLDIGANIGWYTKIANLKGASCIAIEPDPKNFKLLKQNCDHDNNEFYNMCAGNSTDNVYLKLSDCNYGDNRVSADGMGDILCKQTTVDSLIADRASEIRAIKIDTQGWEPNVILGALETLKAVPKDCLIIIEYWPWMLNQNKFTTEAYHKLFEIFTGNRYFSAADEWNNWIHNPDVYSDLVVYKNT